MVKRAFFVMLLALQFLAIANIATAEIPFPQCLPCPEDEIKPPVR